MAQSKPQPITYLARQKTPLAGRTANLLGRPLASTFLRFDGEGFINMAKKQPGLDSFGDDSFREPLRVLLDAIEKEVNLSSFGRFSARRLIIQLLSTRLLLRDMIDRHPEIMEEEIEKPIIVAGLPRTGTTHLHNLLSQDLDLRYMPCNGKAWNHSSRQANTLRMENVIPTLNGANRQFEQLIT